MKTLRRWWRELLGTFLQLAAVGGAVWFAFFDQSHATSPAAAALFVVIAAVLQFGASLLFSRAGRAEPAHARSSVAHLEELAQRAAAARAIAEGGHLKGVPAPTVREALGRVSVDLSWIESGLLRAIRHWIEVRPELADQLQIESEESDDGQN